MSATHLTLELLREAHRGVRSPEDIAVVAIAHLLEVCPQCEEAFETWRQTAGQESERPREPRIGANLCAPDLGDLETWFHDIRGLGEEERREVLRRQGASSQGSRLAAHLLQEARSCLPSRLRDARTLAGLARAILQHSNASRGAAILYASAVAEEGNAARALGDLEASEDLLAAARFLLHAEGCEDPLVLAALDKQEGTLRRYQGRLNEAERLLRHAATAFSREGNSLDAARAFVALGIVYFDGRDFLRAAELAQATFEPLERAGDAATLLCARHNLTAALSESGLTRAAREVFCATQDLYDQEAGIVWTVHRRWLDGNMRWKEGSPDLAEPLLCDARQAWLDQGMVYRAAVVGKDLLAFLAEQRRLDDLGRLADEIIPVFETQNAHHEADQIQRILQGARDSTPPVH